MRSDEQFSQRDHPRRRRRNLDLYFYEQIGSRYYLRITRLGLAAIMLLTVVPIMGILFLLAVNTNS